MKLVASVFALVLALGGCSQGPGNGGRAGQGALTIGLIPEANIFRQLDRYAPVSDYLARETGVPVQLRMVPRYGAVIQSLRQGALDGAFFGSFTYVLAHAKLGAEILARPVRADGTSTYHGLLIVRRDGGIRSVKDMKGKVLCLVDRATMAGYLFPMGYLTKNGVRNHRTYFRESYFAGTQEDVILDVLSGRADVGAVKNTVFERLSSREERVGREVLVLARSRDVPENGLAVRSDLAPGLKKKLKEALLKMHQDPEGARALQSVDAVRYIETTDSDFEPVVQCVRELGLDLTSFDAASD